MGFLDDLKDYEVPEPQEPQERGEVPLNVWFLARPLAGKNAPRLAEYQKKETGEPFHKIRGGFEIIGGPTEQTAFAGRWVFLGDLFLWDFEKKDELAGRVVGLLHALVIPGVGDDLAHDERKTLRDTTFKSRLAAYADDHAITVAAYGGQTGDPLIDRQAQGRMLIDVAFAVSQETPREVLVRRYAVNQSKAKGGGPKLDSRGNQVMGLDIEEATPSNQTKREVALYATDDPF